VEEAVKRGARCEAMVSEVSEEIERNMRKEISGGARWAGRSDCAPWKKAEVVRLGDLDRRHRVTRTTSRD